MSARYFSPDDPETYVTPSQLKRLGRSKQVSYLVHWFHGMFEDPQNETPYAMDKESPYNYEYIWGGPYDAADELGDEFGAIVSDEVIQAAIDEVELDGTTEWAPGLRHPDHKARHEDAIAESYEPPQEMLELIKQRIESGIAPQFGNSDDLAHRVTIRSEIAQFKLLKDQHSIHGGIGHNGPPETLTLSNEDAQDVSAALEAIDQELTKQTPNLHAVVDSAGRIEAFFGWISQKLDKFVDAFVTTAGKAAAVAVVANLAGIPVLASLARVYASVIDWLNALTLPF